MTTALKIPLAGWADRALDALARSTGSAAIAGLTGQGLLGERAAMNGFRVPGLVSAGGGCTLHPTRDGWIALSLARESDRELLPALFGDALIDPDDDPAIAERITSFETRPLVARGAALGLAIAADGEFAGVSIDVAPCSTVAPAFPEVTNRPLVIDLSALWAGPLATHLLQLAGATVLKVESISRPDSMRSGDAGLFSLLNQHKASIALDLRTIDGRDALLALIRKADIVVEASRPRALLQLGIEADALVAEIPGLVWLSITAHGAHEDAASRIGFGDDCGVAGGLSTALRQASGKTGFVGDAIADPLTGIAAARAAWAQWQTGQAARLNLSMSGTVAAALADEEARDPERLASDLRAWAAAEGHPFPVVPSRPSQVARPFGADTPQWLSS